MTKDEMKGLRGEIKAQMGNLKEEIKALQRAIHRGISTADTSMVMSSYGNLAKKLERLKDASH